MITDEGTGSIHWTRTEQKGIWLAVRTWVSEKSL